MKNEVQVYKGKFKSAVVYTWDEKVVKASPSFLWAIGKNIQPVIGWATEHGFNWKVSE